MPFKKIDVGSILSWNEFFPFRAKQIIKKRRFTTTVKFMLRKNEPFMDIFYGISDLLVCIEYYVLQNCGNLLVVFWLQYSGVEFETTFKITCIGYWSDTINHIQWHQCFHYTTVVKTFVNVFQTFWCILSSIWNIVNRYITASTLITSL